MLPDWLSRKLHGGSSVEQKAETSAEPGLLDRFFCCCNSKLLVSVSPLDFLPIHIILWLKILNFSRDMYQEICTIK